MEHKMRVIVFGGTRFMGIHLVRELIRNNHDITIATRGMAEDEFGDDITRIHLDRGDLDSLRKNVPDVTYDVVFDSLAYCSADVMNLMSVIKCKRYIQVSTASVYNHLHMDIKEEEFDAEVEEFIDCVREDASYSEVKRQAECAIVQKCTELPSVRVRFPVVLGEDDYTKRLFFYVEHILSQTPVYVDNFKQKMVFVRSDEAGRFLEFLGSNDYTGAINGASEGTISIKDISDYVESKTGKAIIQKEDGDAAPYNEIDGYDLNMNKAKHLGYTFLPLQDWIYELIDSYIAEITVS